MFYLIDKPIGISSFDVVRRLRRELWTKKIGYLGTLDPLATGCLLIATDNSTKLLSLLESAEKTYIADIRIDGWTDSLDLWTHVTPVDTSEMVSYSREELEDFLYSQKKQVPPKYSSLHVNGERAYNLVRDGVLFDLPERVIHISNVEILEFSPPFFRIRIRISSWWYIRSFAPLIATYFWIQGAWYLSALKREQIHLSSVSIGIESACSLEDFSSEKCLPYKSLFPSIEQYEINTAEYHDLLLGRSIKSRVVANNWQRFFLTYGDIFASLVHFENGSFVIERNKV